MNERSFHSSKAPDAGIALPLFGLFLLMPPVISLFAAPTSLFGVPLIVLYLFGIWGSLIVCAALLSRRLGQAQPPEAEAIADVADTANRPV